MPYTPNFSKTAPNQTLIVTVGSFGKIALQHFLNQLTNVYEEFETRVQAKPQRIVLMPHPWTPYLERVLTIEQKQLADMSLIWPEGLPTPADLTVSFIPIFLSIHAHNSSAIITQYQNQVIAEANERLVRFDGNPDYLTQEILNDHLKAIHALCVFKPVMDIQLQGD